MEHVKQRDLNDFTGVCIHYNLTHIYDSSRGSGTTHRAKCCLRRFYLTRHAGKLHANREIKAQYLIQYFAPSCILPGIDYGDLAFAFQVLESFPDSLKADAGASRGKICNGEGLGHGR